MKINDKPFLHSYKKNFKIGDLVNWAIFDVTENYDTIMTEYKGAIIDIIKIKHYETGRFVNYAVVLPYGETKTVQVPLHKLHKETI